MDNEFQLIRRGRPQKYTNFDRKEYNKQYYEANKDKTKGNFLCKDCLLYCSLSNKSRHMNSKIHQENLIKNREEKEFYKEMYETDLLKNENPNLL